MTCGSNRLAPLVVLPWQMEGICAALVTLSSELESYNACAAFEAGQVPERWAVEALDVLKVNDLPPMRYLLETHRQAFETAKRTTAAAVGEIQQLMMYIVIEQAVDLPWMELGGADPYCICWHEDERPDLRMLDMYAKRRNSCWLNHCGKCSLCKIGCSGGDDSDLPMELRHEYIIETKPIFKNIDNPRWQARGERPIEFRPSANATKSGYLIIEIYDHDYIGQDDPMGRIEIDLDTVEMDKMSEEWYPLGWIPGQTRPAPKGKLQVRLLISSQLEATNELITQRSYDFSLIT